MISVSSTDLAIYRVIILFDNYQLILHDGLFIILL
jgi:hypothetical protein